MDPLSEPIGHWIFTPGAGWNPGTPEFQLILEGDGTVSDIIHVYNDANGVANITFQSGVVPEPSTVLLLVSGLAAVGASRLRRRREASA